MSNNDSIRSLVAAIRKGAAQTIAQCDDLTDLLNHLSIDTAKRNPHTCPRCGIPARSKRQLDEHVYDIHDGPRPAHFDRLEAQIADDWTPEEDAA